MRAGHVVETGRRERILALGANGPTGRETVQQALNRGLEVHALTRHREDFPITHERLRVIAGDATDPSVIDAAVATTDAVICTIGASFTRHPVTVYSISAELLVAALRRHGRRRLIVVTSSGVASSHQRKGAVQRASFAIMRGPVGRTVYDDMAKMESVVSASDLYWTVVHPPGLSSEAGRGYAVAENEIEGNFCTRADLAEMLLDQLDDDRFLRKVAAVTTPGFSVSAIQMFRVEVLKR